MSLAESLLGRALLAPAACALLIAPAVRAQAPQAPAPNAPAAAPAAGEAPLPALATTDIALAEGGLLHGVLVNMENAPVGGATVQFWMQEHEVATTQTDAEGRFAVRGLRGGTYRVVSGDAVQMCRLWAPGTAPPQALRGLVLVGGTSVVRGILPPWYDWCIDPLLVTGLVATAIAVPLALHDEDDEPSSP
jgi:hypothetical protein